MAFAFAPRLKQSRKNVTAWRNNGTLAFAHGFKTPEQHLLQDAAAQLPSLCISFGSLISDRTTNTALAPAPKPLLDASYSCHVRISVTLGGTGKPVYTDFRSAFVRLRGSTTETRSLAIELIEPFEISIGSLCAPGRIDDLLAQSIIVTFQVFANEEPFPFMMDETRQVLRYGSCLTGSFTIEPTKRDEICFATVEPASIERPGVWPDIVNSRPKLAVSAYWKDPFWENRVTGAKYRMILDDDLKQLLAIHRSPVLWIFKARGIERALQLKDWRCAICSMECKDHWVVLTHVLRTHQDMNVGYLLQSDHEYGFRLVLEVGARIEVLAEPSQKTLYASIDPAPRAHLQEPSKPPAGTSTREDGGAEEHFKSQTRANTPAQANQAAAGIPEQRPPLSGSRSVVETVDLTMIDDSDDDEQQAIISPRHTEPDHVVTKTFKDANDVHSSRATSTVSSLENVDPTMPRRVRTKDDHRQRVTKPPRATFRSPLTDAARPKLSPRPRLSPYPKLVQKPQTPLARRKPDERAELRTETSTGRRRLRIPQAPEGVQFYSSITKVSLYEGDSGSESDAGSDDIPVRIELEGKSNTEKFKCIFNAHMHKEHFKADCHFRGCWKRFAEQYGYLVKEHHLLQEFVIRAAVAKLDGLLTEEDITQSVAMVQAAVVEKSLPPQPPPPNSRVGCFCGKKTSDVMSIISCHNVGCADADFHLDCVGLESWQDGWLCPDCRVLNIAMDEAET